MNYIVILLLICRCVSSFNARRSLLQIEAAEEKVPPPWEVNGGNITTVEVSLLISQIRSLLFDAEMSFELHQIWRDPRFYNASGNKDGFTLFKDADFKLLWRPDTYIANELPNGVFETTSTDFVKAFPNGSLFQNTRHSVIFHCNVKLFAIPFNDEECVLKFQSASFSTDVMQLTWKSGGSVNYSPDIQTYVVKITDTQTTSCSKTLDNEASASCLELKLKLKRINRVMLIQVFLPSTCIIFISWLGFWIHHTEVSGRTRISTVCLTAIIAESIAVLIINPDQIQTDAIQAWNAGCIILITAAFLEFVIVHNIHRRNERRPNKAPAEARTECVSDSAGTSNVETKKLQKRKSIPRKTTSKVSPVVIHVVPEGGVEDSTHKKDNKVKPETVDTVSAIIYVVLFLAFNVFYWTYFITSSNQ